MSKILITSDIHFDSYPNRTPSKDYRLNQSYQVTENLLEVARREGAEYLFILGDILEKQNRDSPIHSVVKNCLHKLASGFRKSFYILGNHDMSAKSLQAESTEGDLLSSYLHLYVPDNLVYMDKKILDLDGMTFGFRNYSAASTLDLEFITSSGRTQVDVLCGHSSQSYQEGDPPYQVQEYDEGKVGMYAFFGHIHQSVWKGNKISVGVPQRAKITDDSPKVVILDTITKAWKYVDADPGRKLMDFVETTAAKEDYFDPSKNIYYIVKKKPTENTELLKAVSATGYDKIFEEEIKARGLQEIHQAVKDATPSESLERLDLDFQITRVKIHNWRSIKDHTQTFTRGGKYLVSGHNGAGKSSLYSALAYGLSGKCPGSPKDNIRFGEKEMSVEVSLSYHGSEYIVKRGTSILELWKSGVRMELGNKTQTKDGIIKELPFIEAMDLLYYNDGNQRILGQSSSSDTAKLQILYKILGLNEIDAYNSVSTEIHKKLSKEFIKTRELFLVSEATIGEKKNYLNSLELRYGGVSGFDPQTRLQELRGTLDGYRRLHQEKQEYDRKIQENSRIVSEISGTELLISSLKETLSGMRSKEELYRELNSLSLTLQENQRSLNSLLGCQSEYSKLLAYRELILREGTEIKEQLDNLEEETHKPYMCQAYGKECPMITEEIKRERFKKQREELEAIRLTKLQEYQKISDQISKISFTQEDIQKASNLVSETQGKIAEVNGKLSDYQRVEKQLQDKLGYLEKLKSRVASELPLPVELPVDILDRISELSTEISTLSGYQRLLLEYQVALQEHQKIKDAHDNASKTLSGYSEYIALTKPSGVVYTKIFEIIMGSFSDQKVRYEVNVTKRGESRYINILSYLKKSTGEVSYQGASQGERCMMDIHFLSNLKVRFGLLILDEFLGNLDQDNHDDALTKMQSLETNLLFVTSHKENLIPFPNRIEASTVGGNETKYTIG